MPPWFLELFLTERTQTVLVGDPISGVNENNAYVILRRQQRRRSVT